jgi:hypothetical protein
MEHILLAEVLLVAALALAALARPSTGAARTSHLSMSQEHLNEALTSTKMLTCTAESEAGSRGGESEPATITGA